MFTLVIHNFKVSIPSFQVQIHFLKTSLFVMLQGCFAEVQSDHEQQVWTRSNVMMMYQLGVFTAVVELLSLEME